ncbi:hypothetical protein KIL84_003749 [Mauremys mutica]|uniref:Ninjurin 1 n=1 Tax=Mauremys mutica TaxID=74926 RepID=A0A9D3WW79_9SAUR|nr:hypothetical protein KIL84_003749 [Mauremys mutica]
MKVRVIRLCVLYADKYEPPTLYNILWPLSQALAALPVQPARLRAGTKGNPGRKGKQPLRSELQDGTFRPGPAAACVCAARWEGRHRARLGRRRSGPCGQGAAAEQAVGHSTIAEPENMQMNEQAGSEGAALNTTSSQRDDGCFNVNRYANKKSAAESMLDIALLMANATQLKAVMEQGPSFSFYIPLIVLISISLILQVAVGVLLIFLGTY